MFDVRKTVLFGAAAVLALGMIAVPVGFDQNGVRLDTAAAAGKGGGMGEDCEPTKKLKGNNGVGNGLDPQPPGNPPINDGLGTGPGNPGNRGGVD